VGAGALCMTCDLACLGDVLGSQRSNGLSPGAVLTLDQDPELR